jgi:hypothetical protein
MFPGFTPLMLAAVANCVGIIRLLVERGEAVQVEPMRSMLKAPDTQRLKLKNDNLLSNFAFEFNLRRYSVAPTAPRRQPLHHRLL